MGPLSPKSICGDAFEHSNSCDCRLRISVEIVSDDPGMFVRVRKKMSAPFHEVRHNPVGQSPLTHHSPHGGIVLSARADVGMSRAIRTAVMITATRFIL